MPQGKTKYLHDKSKNFTAKSNISRQNQKPHGKTKNLTAKPETSRQNQTGHLVYLSPCLAAGTKKSLPPC